MADDEALTSDERAAEKAAKEQEQAVIAALLSALLLLRPQVVTVTWWLPTTWDEFKQAAGSAIDPAFDAFDKAARAVWMGFDSLDAATLEIQRRMKERFVQEFGDATRRAVEKIVTWGQANGVPAADVDGILPRIAGVNGNQVGPILAKWLEMREGGASSAALDKFLADAGKKALKDRAGTVAGDVLWDAVQHGRMAGGQQEQRATNAQVLKSWYAVLDERQCGVCGSLHGMTVPIASPFPGGIMAPKAHSLCRCRLQISISEEGAF